MTGRIFENDLNDPLTPGKRSEVGSLEVGSRTNSSYSRRRVFDNLHTPAELAREIQRSADDIVENCSEFEWDENHISFQIVVAIREVLSGYSIPNIKNTTNLSRFDLEAYKITGKPEQTHGDIAFVVTRLFADSPRSITGVGFYEAKASSANGYDYPSFKTQQLRRLVTHTPKLSYLIYSRRLLKSNDLDWPAYVDVESGYGDLNYVQTVDANMLKEVRNINEAVSLVGLSFGHHFVQRILSGRDLDYSRKPIDTVRRWLKVTKRANALVVSITVMDSSDPLGKRPQLPGFVKVDMPSLTGRGRPGLPFNDK